MRPLAPGPVPLAEAVHEAELARIPFQMPEIAEDPLAFFERLPEDARQRLAGRAGVPADRVRGARLVSGRGRGGATFLLLSTDTLAARMAAPLLALRFRPAQVAGPPLALAPGLPPHRRPVLAALEAAQPEGTPLYDPGVEGPLEPHPAPFRHVEERYWIDEPFSRVAVCRGDGGERVYAVEEPILTALETEALVRVNARLRDRLLVTDAADAADPVRELVVSLFGLLDEAGLPLSRRSRYRIGYRAVRDYAGFGRLQVPMLDPHVEDISCNGPGVPLYIVHSKKGNLRSTIQFEEGELDSFAIKLAQRGGKLLSVAQPLADATLPDGSRIQTSLGREVTSRGSAFTIRRFRADPITPVDLITSGTQTSATLALLWLIVEAKRSLIVMGATASGKTTTLGCLSHFIPPASKIVTIEDTREMALQHENWLAAVTREPFAGREEGGIGMFDLLRAALRQRPDYLIVGEIRGVEGLTLFQAMSTGHTCFSTMHAGSVPNAVYRLENPPVSVPRVMLTALDFFLIQAQVEVDGKAVRRMISLTELGGLDPATRNLRTNEVIRWDSGRDAYVAGRSSANLDHIRAKRGWSERRLEEELAARQAVLDGLVARRQRDARSVANAVRGFYRERAAAIPITVPVRESAARPPAKEVE